MAMGLEGTRETTQLPHAIVVMGVSGSGKTTIGKALAERLGFEFRDGDEFHPKANVEKMRAGIALNDDDRAPWLEAIAAWIDEQRAAGRHGVVACSALKRSYRAMLRGARPDVCLVYLKGGKELIGRRMAARQGHYMPASLLDSQFAALEEPGDDEGAIVVSIADEPAAIVEAIVEKMSSPLVEQASVAVERPIRGG
jgi:gluconokinase